MRKIPFARFAVLALVFQALLVTPLAAMAQQPTPSDDDVIAIAKQLFCPVCENIPLDDCDTQACAQWRELIREKLADGWSEKQIINYFIEQYGARVVGVPPAEGLHWSIYLTVAAIVTLSGAFVLYSAIRSKEPPATQAPTPSASDEYIARLEEEVKKR